MFVCSAVQIISSLHNQRNIIICADMAASSTMLLRVFYTFLCYMSFSSAICSAVVPLRSLLTVLWWIWKIDLPEKNNLEYFNFSYHFKSEVVGVNTEYQLWSPHALNTDLSPELLQVFNILWI